QPIPSIARLVTVPADITRLVTALLAKLPQDRPPTAADVVAEIDRWLASQAPRTVAPRGSLRTAIAIASGLALSMSIIGAWFHWRRTSGRTPARAAVSTEMTTIERMPIADGSRVVVDTSAPTLPVIEPDAGAPDAPV